MATKMKRKDGDSNSGSDAEPPAKKAFQKKPSSDNDSDGDDDIIVCEISKNRRVSVRSWQGKVVVDIREFYVKDGKQMPGKKGISLYMDQWKILRDHVDKIDAAVGENN